jgi:phytoene desaturase
MRPVFEELFAAAGRRLEDYIELQPVEPLTRYFYGDGTVLDATRDLSRMVEQIRRLDARDVEGYLAYLSYVARLHRVTGPAFIYGAPPSWRTVAQVAPADALRLEPWLTMDAAIRRYVRSPHLRQLLGRFATYVGGSPFRAPATLNVIAHVELNEGIWYPRGGVYAIAAGLERLARELGVEIRTGCPVARIHVPGTSEVPLARVAKPACPGRQARERAGTSSTSIRAAGVLLADGERIAADAVLSNVDVAHTLTNLLPREAVDLGRLRRLTRAEPSCSGFILLLGVRGEFPQLAQHNIFFSSDYPREFDDIFRRGAPPDEPTVYVAITSKADPDHAPPGHENWFVLVNAPAVGQERLTAAGERCPPWDWEREKGAYRDRVLATLARFGLDVRERIVVEEIFTPADLARQTGSWRGALYGASPNNMLAAFRRPPVRYPRVAGLYFVGGTTHPGGGVPMVILSGRLAARTILADLQDNAVAR